MRFKLLLVVACVVLLSCGMANAQNGVVILDSIDGIWGTGMDSIRTVTTADSVRFYFSWVNNTAFFMTGCTNGFEFYLTGGTRGPVVCDEAFFVSQMTTGCANQNFSFFNIFSVDGVGADTIGLGSYAMGAPGFESGVTCDMAHFAVAINADAHGYDFCIDSAFYPPGGEWLWSDATDGYYPAWEGPHCFVVVDSIILGVEGPAEPNPGPVNWALEQNYPNPFNPTTTIKFDVKENAHVNLSIYNVLGQKVKTLVDDYKVKDSYEAIWGGDSDHGSEVSTGVYFYKLETDKGFTMTKKMMLLK